MGEGDKINFYAGADYGLNPGIKSEYAVWENAYQDKIPAGNFAFTTDPRTINQIKAVSDKISTGTKSIEVSGVSPQVLEAIPKQHFKEIQRLKDIAGVDLTFHGPLVEASGWGEGGWSEYAQKGAERQMTSAIERAHDLDPKGNIIVTFHSSNSLPELETTQYQEEGKSPEVSELIVYDEYDGQATRVRPKEERLFTEKGIPKKLTPKEQLELDNEERWRRELANTNFHIVNGAESLERPSRVRLSEDDKKELGIKNISELYKLAKSPDFSKYLEKLSPDAKDDVIGYVDRIYYGENYVRDAYNSLKKQFNKAWISAEKTGNKNDLNNLKEFQSKISKIASNEKEFSNYIKNPDNLLKFSRLVQDGVNVLSSVDAPEALRPMNEFLVDKSSDTFANVALNSYKKFKSNAPVISIENPPAGAALSKGEDLKKLVKAAQDKFTKKAKDELGLSESEARKQAEKLIGVTWDVGHINMLRKYGYDDKALAKETEKVAKDIKHIHLSDNFGFEHTELPMGMGDVPLKAHKKALEKYGTQLKKLKQVVETGGPWFEQFKNTPVTETLRAFGSPVYAMDMSPTWNQTANASGGYWAGYGATLPEQHFSTYGAGFSNLPPELGGQMSGRNRLSGSPME
jgi:hypothetical protein